MQELALIIRHAEPETLAENYTSALLERGFELRPLNVFESAPEFDQFDPPALEEVDLIISLGGPMSANDCYPALLSERRYLVQAIKSGVPVFGVCLGAQLMAKALGGKVTPTGGYEFGLRKIWITKEGSRDPVFRQAPCASGTDTSRGGVHRSTRRYRVGVRLHALPRWNVQETEPRLSIRHTPTRFSSSLSLRSMSCASGTGNWPMTTRRWAPNSDASLEAETNLRDFAAYAPIYEAQTRTMLIAFCDNAGLV